jgi:hypothetical protein
MYERRIPLEHREPDTGCDGGDEIGQGPREAGAAFLAPPRFAIARTLLEQWAASPSSATSAPA